MKEAARRAPMVATAPSPAYRAVHIPLRSSLRTGSVSPETGGGKRTGRFRSQSEAAWPCIAETAPDHIDALIRLEIACNLALDALPELPTETAGALRDPIRTLCDVTGNELDRLSPGWRGEPPAS